jgi:hypothetical protein
MLPSLLVIWSAWQESNDLDIYQQICLLLNLIDTVNIYYTLTTLRIFILQCRTEKKPEMFKKINADLVVHLPPKFSNSLREGINDYLSTMVTKYIPELKAVVLSHENIKSYAKTAVIKTESPFLHFKINVDFIVFKPVLDSVLGKISRFNFKSEL